MLGVTDTFQEGALQVTDGCAGYMVGDTSFLFSLSVENLTEAGGTLGAYGVNFTNVAGSVSVPEIRVVGPGMEILIIALEDPSLVHIYPKCPLYPTTFKKFL